MRDSDMRTAVRGWLRAEHAHEPDTRFVEEMGIWANSARVDIAVINGELSGYELKSNADTLERLEKQIEIYGKVFDRMTLVVGDKHAKSALKLVPKWWGCVVATMRDDAVTLKPRRKGRPNPTQDPTVVVQMLWKDEAIAALEMHGLAAGWRSRRASEISERLLSELPFSKVAEHVRDALKIRQKLGQLASSEFNVPIDAIANPACGAAG